MNKENKSCKWPTFYTGYITGMVESCVLFDSFKKEDLCQLLPPGYRLARQTVAPPGKHPIYWCFNLRQKKVGTPLPFLCLNYHEFAFVIPHVHCTSENNDVGAYVPTLYLNSLGGVIGGRLFYQLNKHLKRCSVSTKNFDSDSTKMTAINLINRQLLVSGSFEKSGKAFQYQDSENFMRIKPMLDQKLLSHGLQGYKSSKFLLDYDQLFIHPLISEVKTSDFLPGMENLERTIPSIEDSIMGGFYFKTSWKLDLPKT